MKAFIHNSRFSSNYTYEEIKEKLGLPFVPPNGKIFIPKYKYVTYRQLENGVITIYFYPNLPGMPNSYFTTSHSSYELFEKLHKALPDLKVSSLEYTIDLYCKDEQHIADLFYLLRKNMYFSRGKITASKGGRVDGADLVRTTNSVYQVNLDSRSRYIKIYERGNDEDKSGIKKKVWQHGDCNRVRIEFTYKRPILKKATPDTIEDLLLKPNLNQILGS